MRESYIELQLKTLELKERNAPFREPTPQKPRNIALQGVQNSNEPTNFWLLFS